MILWFIPAIVLSTHLNFHAQWSIGLFTVVMALTCFPRSRKLSSLLSFFTWFYYINSFLTVFRGYGFLGNGSMDASFIACLFVGLRVNPIPLVLVMLATQAWGPVFVLIASLAARYPRRVLSVLGIGIVFAWWRGFDSGRFLVWEYAFRFYLCNSPSWAFGLGWGQFREIMPRLQLARGGDPASLFLNAHNDYLQVLFEFGILGLIAALLFMEYALTRAQTPRLKAAWCALFGMAFLNMPLHLFYGCLWAVTLFTMTQHETSPHLKR